MHVTARLAGQADVDVEVGEECRTLQAVKEAIAETLPQLCVEGFDVSVGRRALDDETIVSLEDGVCLDVVPNARVCSVVALREAGHEVSEAGLLAAHSDVSLCTLYLDAGVQVDCVDGCGCTPLHYACLYGHLEVVTLLLDRGSVAIDRKECSGNTPLLVACRLGYLKVARLLLDRGSDAIDEKDSYDTTPLLAACSYGHLEVVTLLLDRGSDAIDKKSRFGKTPLLAACCDGHLEVARLLLDRGSDATDEKDSDDTTPLLAACRYGHLEVARLLLDRGSDAINEKDSDNNTPFHLACRGGHLEVAALLLDRGACDHIADGVYPPDVRDFLEEGYAKRCRIGKN